MATAVTFNTLTDVKKAQRMLFIGDSGSEMPMAYATSAGLSFSADDIDVSNKADGGWATSMQGKKSAEISVDGLVAANSTMADEGTLFNAFKNGTTLKFKYAYVTIAESSDGTQTTVNIDTTKPMYTGSCVITSLDLTSDNGDVCKYSASIKAQGAVVKS